MQAEALWLREHPPHPIADVFILAVVSNVRVKWQIDLFVDPWDLHTKGMLRLGNVAHYIAQFQHDAPHISLRDLHPSFPPIPATGTAEEYQYRTLVALDHFRLFELSPGKGSEPLHGILRHHSLDDISSASNAATRYTALSYQWGSSLSPFEVMTPEGTIPIMLSLYNALRLIRHPTEKLTIWADALCINQQNQHERRLQVRLMKKIFQSANEVYAYLGEGDEQSDKSMKALADISAACRPAGGTWTIAEGHNLPPEDDAIWEDIRQLLGRGWFRRVWVIQEAVLARNLTLYCGDFNMRWDSFWRAILVCTTTHSGLNSDGAAARVAMYPVYALGLAREFYNSLTGIANSHDMLTLLQLFSHTEASEPVDKLFGLLGLADDTDDRLFDPDYESPPERVVLRYATAFVRRRQTVKLLCRAGGSRSSPFPSWIPNWTRTARSGTISTWYGDQGLFTASKQTRPEHHHASVVESKGMLWVKATRLTKIHSVGSETLENSDLIKFLASIMSDVDALPFPETWTYPPTGETRQKLGLALVLGGTKRPHFDHTPYRYHKYRSEVGDPRNNTTSATASPFSLPIDTSSIPNLASIQDFLDKFLKQPPAARQLVWDYWHTVTSFSRRLGNARFFFAGTKTITTTVPDLMCHVGMGPGEIEEGDEVWIVHGMGTPVVLRPRTSGEKGNGSRRSSEYELVGEAYVHDPKVMYGDWLGEGGNVGGKLICLV